MDWCTPIYCWTIWTNMKKRYTLDGLHSSRVEHIHGHKAAYHCGRLTASRCHKISLQSTHPWFLSCGREEVRFNRRPQEQQSDIAISSDLSTTAPRDEQDTSDVAWDHLWWKTDILRSTPSVRKYLSLKWIKGDVSKCILVLNTSIFIYFDDKYFQTEGVASNISADNVQLG